MIAARGNIPGIGYTKTVMTSLNPGFDEVKLGSATWGEFVTAAADAGFVVLEGHGASTVLKVPIKLSRSTKDSLDSLQKGFDSLVSTVRKMEYEKKSTELSTSGLAHAQQRPLLQPCESRFPEVFRLRESCRAKRAGEY